MQDSHTAIDTQTKKLCPRWLCSHLFRVATARDAIAPSQSSTLKVVSPTHAR